MLRLGLVLPAGDHTSAQRTACAERCMPVREQREDTRSQVLLDQCGISAMRVAKSAAHTSAQQARLLELVPRDDAVEVLVKAAEQVVHRHQAVRHPFQQLWLPERRHLC